MQVMSFILSSLDFSYKVSYLDFVIVSDDYRFIIFIWKISVFYFYFYFFFLKLQVSLIIRNHNTLLT